MEGGVEFVSPLRTVTMWSVPWSTAATGFWVRC